MRYRLVIIVLYFIVACFRAQAGDLEYAYTHIPENLLKGADAVIRNYHTSIHIISKNEVYITEDYAVTVLNKNGERFATLHEYYDKFRSVEKVEGTLYDAAGNKLKRLKKKDIQDGAVCTVNFFDDYRYKSQQFNYASYPYTCEYHIEKKYDYTFNLPVWQPQMATKCAIEKADIDIDYPKDLNLKYRSFHISMAPQITTDFGQTTMKLLLENIAVAKQDRFAPKQAFSLPTLVLAANNFAVEDKIGSMSTWEDLGKFGYELNANRDDLPENIQKAVHALTDTCHDAYQKISLLYEYLKNNTRYVSIQLGIGGWQTFEAKFVAEKGYGDCKALSNYMKALLKEAGIVSYQAWAYAGEDEENIVEADFPSNRFNHVILCVPYKKDTVWLECTSKTCPPGYLSSFTNNRNVLLLTPDGGRLIKTPAYTISDNYEYRNAQISIDNYDRVTGNATLIYNGYFWDKESRYFLNKPATEIENYLNRKFTLPSYKVDHYTFTNEKSNSIPSLQEDLSISGSANISRTGKRVFIIADIFPFDIGANDLFSSKERKDSFQITNSIRIADTLVINLKSSYIPEFIPPPTDIKYPFAEYHSKLLFENNTLKLIRTYKQQEGIYPPGIFTDYIKLNKEINQQNDKNKVVLVKKE